MENKKNINIVWIAVICLILIGVLIFININNKINIFSNNNDKNNVANNTTNNVVSAKEVAKAGDTVAINYIGRLEDGTIVASNAHSKFRRLEPLMFTLGAGGAGQVTTDLGNGIVGMKVGEKKTITIPPEDNGTTVGDNGWLFPLNSSLVFEVELLTIYKEFIKKEDVPTKWIEWISQKQRNLSCVQDSDCVIRVNNYGKVTACLAQDKECADWEKTIETGSPGHGESPNPNEVIAYCDKYQPNYGNCKVRYDCSKCDILKKNFSDYCPTYMGGTSGWVCRMYNDCNCN